MTMHPYVSFKGDCEAAFTFYEQHLDGQPGPIFRYAGTELAGNVPSDWSNKVMHGSITIGEQVLMGAERIFHALADGGKVVMALEKTFWAERFGMVVDRFGVPWLINGEG
jgi:PhnB protein